MLRVAIERPPNFAEIARVFVGVERVRGVLFCYGDTVFDPDGVGLTDALLAHEQVHSDRQGSTPDEWWARYLTDTAFRLGEEVPAHQAEYRVIYSAERERSQRRQHLKSIAQRLSGPLYSHMLTFDKARKLISEAA